MELVVDPDFLADLQFWTTTDARTAARILRLVEEIRRDPFRGTGKPEPLRHLGAGVWSRRVTQADRRAREIVAVPLSLLVATLEIR